jgi:hypothetical protein
MPALPFTSQGLELRLLCRIQESLDSIPAPRADLADPRTEFVAETGKLLACLAQNDLDLLALFRAEV